MNDRKLLNIELGRLSPEEYRAKPASGLARERLGSDETVTTDPMELVDCTLSCPFIPCPPWQIHFSEPWIPSFTTCLGSSGLSLSCQVGQAFLQASKTHPSGRSAASPWPC